MVYCEINDISINCTMNLRGSYVRATPAHVTPAVTRYLCRRRRWGVDSQTLQRIDHTVHRPISTTFQFCSNLEEKNGGLPSRRGNTPILCKRSTQLDIDQHEPLSRFQCRPNLEKSADIPVGDGTHWIYHNNSPVVVGAAGFSVVSVGKPIGIVCSRTSVVAVQNRWRVCVL